MTANIRAVAFDFDGVFVLDSEGLFKKEAWDKILGDYPGHEPFLKEGNRLFGSGKKGGRKEILEHVFRGLGKTENEIEGLVQNALAAFNQHVQARIQEVGLVEGARELLETLAGRDVPLYLNSGSATPALREAVENLGIKKYFSDVFGSTVEPEGGSKVENLARIAEREKISPAEVLFVGDGETDWQAAKAFGCPFVGVVNHWNRWENKPFPLVRSLREVASFL